MIRNPLAALLPVALALSGCGVLTAKLEAKTVCATLADYQLPGSDESGAIDTDVTYDLGDSVPIVSDSGTAYDLKLQSVELSLGSDSGLTDLGGLEAASVGILAPPGTALPEPVLISYARGADLHPTSIVVDSPTGLDLQPYVLSKTVSLHVHAAGTLPTQPWHATMKACFALEVTLDYGKKL
jgi:hypothetical protein